jgi:hypothetical protein
MIGFLILFLHILVSPFKTRAQLEAEISVLRHQLGVLRQQAGRRHSRACFAPDHSEAYGGRLRFPTWAGE